MAGYTKEEFEQYQGEKPAGDGQADATPTATPSGTSTQTANGQEPVAVSPEQQASAVSPEQQREEAVAGYKRPLEILQEEIEKRKPETDAEKKKRERQERSKKIIAAVSDGLGALSNLYFTSQYAPNVSTEKGGQLGAVDDRIEKLKAEREKQHDQYINFSLKSGALENEKAATLRALEEQQQRMKLANEDANRKAQVHEWLAARQDDMNREQKGKADKAEQEAITAQAVAESAPELQRAKIATEEARGQSYRASTADKYASAAAHGRSNAAEFYAWDERGREYKFLTKAAADSFAKQHGTYQEENVEETTSTETRRTPESKPQQRTSVKKKVVGHAARPAQGTMPGVNTNNKMPGTK